MPNYTKHKRTYHSPDKERRPAVLSNDDPLPKKGAIVVLRKSAMQKSNWRCHPTAIPIVVGFPAHDEEPMESNGKQQQLQGMKRVKGSQGGG